jgi:hypothetical protein
MMSVHDLVEHGVEHGAGPEGQQVRVGLQAPPHRLERAALAVPHRDDEVLADEQHDLADLDVGGLVHVAQRLDDHEQRVAVELELGALMGVDRVLDRERVQLQLVGDLVELRRGRLVQADPHEAVALPARGVQGVAQVAVDVVAAALTVDGAIHDHGGHCPGEAVDGGAR